MRRILIVTLALALVAVSSMALADGPNVETVINSIQLGMTHQEVSKKIDNLKKATVALPGMEAYELAAGSGELASLKCAFKSDKLVLLSFETREGTFDKVKSLLEARYGKFPEGSTLEKKAENLVIRLTRAGEDGSAAQVIINNPDALPGG